MGYFEIKVVLGGFYNQVAIGVTTDAFYPLSEFIGYQNNSVSYHGDDGKCYINGHSFTYGPKFGSSDAVGCGVTTHGNVYFTYNGMLLPKIKFEELGNFYPAFSIRGKLTTVRFVSDQK